MSTPRHPLHLTRETAAALKKVVKAVDRPPVLDERARSGKSGLAGRIADGIYRFVLTGDWTRQIVGDEEISDSAYRAKARIIYSDAEKYIAQDKPNDQDYVIYNPDINLGRPGGSEGDQVYAYLHKGRWELLNFETDETVRAKELFPAVYYSQERKDASGNAIRDENNLPIVDEYILCPGGRDEKGPTKIIHVLDLQARKWSTSTFGKLPVSMSNFAAVVVENGYGEPELVCLSGQTEETDQNPIQLYNFAQDVWRRTHDKQSFAGCPALGAEDGTVLIVGGQSAYYIGEKMPIYSGSGGIQQYGWTASPLWLNDVTAGTVGPRYPLRQVNYSLSSVDKEKSFMKTNFGAALYRKSENGKNVSYLAFGGTETVSSHNNAVVSYNDDSYVDTENHADRLYDKVLLFPDSPVPLGECAVVKINRIGNDRGGMKPANRVLCFGGRMRQEVEEIVELPGGGKVKETKIVFVPHPKVWSLELDDKKWIDDLFSDPIPIPRWNAPVVGVTLERQVPVDPNYPENDETETVVHDLVFFIGGRNEAGLLADVDVLNLTTKKWGKRSRTLSPHG